MALIGIMGGTFNPIHLGHIAIAEAAYEQYHLDEIWVMPNHIPAYKSQEDLISGEDRIEMVRIAIKDLPYCKVSDFELNRKGNTYTVDTLRLLKLQYPNDSFYFIMGADSLFYFDKWKEADQIPQYAILLVAPRDEMSKDEVSAKIKECNVYYGGEYFKLINCRQIPCSSSEIRSRIKDCAENVEYCEDDISEKLYLSTDVYQYIIENHLYK